MPIPGYLVGAGLSSYIAQRRSERRALNVGLVAILVGSAVVLIPGLFGLTTALTLIGGATIYFLGAGILFPAATTGALSPFPYHAGTGGAILGGMQNLGAGIATLLASFFPAQDQMPLGCLMMAMSIIAMFGLRWVNRKHDHSNEMPLAI